MDEKPPTPDEYTDPDAGLLAIIENSLCWGTVSLFN